MLKNEGVFHDTKRNYDETNAVQEIMNIYLRSAEIRDKLHLLEK